MRVKTSVLTCAAILGLAQAAGAAVPKVAGKYAVMVFEQCTSAFNYTNDTFLRSPNGSEPGVKGINSISNGEFGIEVGTFSFPATAATTGNATVALTNVHGDALRINGGGSAVTVQTENLPGTFSVNATTVTFKPTGQPLITWTASYGDLVAGTGVARTIYLVREDDTSCVQGLTLTKQ